MHTPETIKVVPARYPLRAVGAALALLALALVGKQAQLGMPYWTALGISMVLVAWQFWIARRRERGACFRAFLHNNWVGAAVFAGIAVHYAIA